MKHKSTKSRSRGVAVRVDEYTVVIHELGDRYQVSNINPYLLGAATVLDLAGSAVKCRFGSIDQDSKALKKDMVAIGDDWKRVFQRQYETLSK